MSSSGRDTGMVGGVTETRALDEMISEALAVIDKGLGDLGHRELVSSNEVADLLLDVRTLLATPASPAGDASTTSPSGRLSRRRPPTARPARPARSERQRLSDVCLNSLSSGNSPSRSTTRSIVRAQVGVALGAAP